MIIGLLNDVAVIQWLYSDVAYVFVTDLGLDLQDSLGRHEVGAVENVIRIRVNDGGGCHFRAHFNINRVCVCIFVFEVIEVFRHF